MVATIEIRNHVKFQDDTATTFIVKVTSFSAELSHMLCDGNCNPPTADGTILRSNHSKAEFIGKVASHLFPLCDPVQYDAVVSKVSKAYNAIVKF